MRRSRNLTHVGAAITAATVLKLSVDDARHLWGATTIGEAATALDRFDPKMAVTIVHGWDDLSCPYFASRLIVAQLPGYGRTDRVDLRMYPGGHMFYARPDSGAAFRRDMLAAYRAS